MDKWLVIKTIIAPVNTVKLTTESIQYEKITYFIHRFRRFSQIEELVTVSNIY